MLQIFIFNFLKQVRSEKFVHDVGFKTTVSLDDVLEVLKLWRRENPFSARYVYDYDFSLIMFDLIYLGVISLASVCTLNIFC